MHRSRFLSPNVLCKYCSNYVLYFNYVLLYYFYYLPVISIPTWIPNKEQVCQTRCKQCKDVLEIPTCCYIQVSQVLSACDIIPTCCFIQVSQVLSSCDIIPTCCFIQVLQVLSSCDIIPTCCFIQVLQVLSACDIIPTCCFIQVLQVLSACDMIPTCCFIQVSQVLSACDIIPTCCFIQVPQVLSACDIIPTCCFIQVPQVLSACDIIPTCCFIQVSQVLSACDIIPTCRFVQVSQVLSACYAEFPSILLSVPNQEFLPRWDVSDGAVIDATTVLEGQQVLFALTPSTVHKSQPVGMTFVFCVDEMINGSAIFVDLEFYKECMNTLKTFLYIT